MRAHLAFASWERAEFERRAAAIQARDRGPRWRIRSSRKQARRWKWWPIAPGRWHAMPMPWPRLPRRVSANAQHVAGAADQAMKNAQIVAAASEELAAAIHEVVVAGRACEHGRARRGGQGSRCAADTIRSLSQAAERIGAVVRLIADIAAQDQSAGVECHDRGGARRRGRQGVRRGGRRGEGAGGADRQGDRGDLAADQWTAWRHRGVGGRGRGDRSHAGRGGAGCGLGRGSDRAADRGHQGDRPQRHRERRGGAGGDQRGSPKSRGEARGDRRSGGAVCGRRPSTVAADIAVLRGALVRTVRTATAEADRRQEARTAVDESCTRDVRRRARHGLPAMLRDLSHNGGAIEAASGRRRESAMWHADARSSGRCAGPLRRSTRSIRMGCCTSGSIRRRWSRHSAACRCRRCWKSRRRTRHDPGSPSGFPLAAIARVRRNPILAHGCRVGAPHDGCAGR